MKKLFTIFALTVFAVTLSCSQTTSQENQEAKLPKIEFSFVEFDYGTIQQGANGTCEFEFTNKGDEALVLNDVRSSCGCTVPAWPQEPIKKGGKAKITVNYDTKRTGPFNKTITVVSNASNSPVVLRIKGNVNPEQANID
jgi:hypothetical protein